MLTTTKPSDRPKQDRKSPLTNFILQPGDRMELQDFFDKWVPTLYNIDKFHKTAQWARDFRTGDRLSLTWRQACLREIQHWNISLDSARNWGSDWEKATDMARRYAYIMDAVLQENFCEISARKTIRN